ncbi:hypothetical protein IPG41_04390 [Candidatus Peregrinibacteria bacterium]|nr:MAG: hypothetical protein IPG41_04390 [Candidatus Peregrinibacteria bacterium]
MNSVLLGKKGVPPMPKQDHAIRSAQAALTRDRVSFMIEAENFDYQTKLMWPRDRIDLLKALLGVGGAKRQSEDPFLSIDLNVKNRLINGKPGVPTPTWYWDLYQRSPQSGDKPELDLQTRCTEFLRSLPIDMRGTDLWTWATRLATKLYTLPPNVQPNGSSAQAITILNEEGFFLHDGGAWYVGGAFHSSVDEPHVTLRGYDSKRKLNSGQLLAAIHGPISLF